MALPWLIGAAVIGLGTALVSALSDDDKSSNNNGDDEEQRKREQAERERRVRERREKKTAAMAEFSQQGETLAADFQQALHEIIDVTWLEKPAFKAILNEDGSQNKRFIGEYFVSEQGLHFLDETTQKNLKLFETLYAAELTPEPSLYDVDNQLSYCHQALGEIAARRQQLERLRRQLTDHHKEQ